jgi:hypothetical protein
VRAPKVIQNNMKWKIMKKVKFGDKRLIFERKMPTKQNMLI